MPCSFLGKEAYMGRSSLCRIFSVPNAPESFGWPSTKEASNTFATFGLLGLTDPMKLASAL